jgi:CTP synthase
VLAEGSKAQRAYGEPLVQERHRHRYEFNNQYRKQFEAHGMRFSGLSPDGKLVEAVELPNHPWFVAVQCHPEFRSKPTQAHPLFRGFVKAALERRERKKAEAAARARAAALAAAGS